MDFGLGFRVADFGITVWGVGFRESGLMDSDWGVGFRGRGMGYSEREGISNSGTAQEAWPRISGNYPYGDWSKFPIIRGLIFGFPLQHRALYKFPPFWEQ